MDDIICEDKGIISNLYRINKPRLKYIKPHKYHGKKESLGNCSRLNELRTCEISQYVSLDFLLQQETQRVYYKQY